jgi:hypothetical protein
MCAHVSIIEQVREVVSTMSTAIETRDEEDAGIVRAPPHARRAVGRREPPRRLWPLGGSRCPGTAVRLGIRWSGALGDAWQPRAVPGLHTPSEDGDRRNVGLAELLCGSDRAPLGLSHRDHGTPAVGDELAEPALELRQE